MENREYELAKKRVKKKKGFYAHLATYLIVNSFITLSALFYSGEFLFPAGPWLPWGVGLAFHYLSVFGFPGSGIMSKEWEEKEMEKEMRKYQESPKELPSAGPPLEETDKEELELKELKELKRKWNEDDLV